MELLIPLMILALLVPMFLGVRRQKKEMAKSAELQDSLQVGDRVVTTSGIYGTIVEIDENSVDLEIAEEVVTTWLRLAIREKVADDHFDSEEAATEAPEALGTTPSVEESAQQTERRLNQE